MRRSQSQRDIQPHHGRSKPLLQFSRGSSSCDAQWKSAWISNSPHCTLQQASGATKERMLEKLAMRQEKKQEELRAKADVAEGETC